MSLSEALNQGFSTTVVGLVIVFAVLILLMLVLMGMKKVFYKNPDETKKQDLKTEENSSAIGTTAQTVSEDIDEDELIAVLTAAIAASLKTSTYNLQIKSYKRVGADAPAWNRAGINENINSRF